MLALCKKLKYFSIEELCSSVTANNRNIDNTPTDEAVRNMEYLIHDLLDVIRENYGKPIIVNSGYRCQRLNNAVGGAKNSQHLTGKAVDIVSVQKTRSENKKLIDLIEILQLEHIIEYDQLIWEYGDSTGPAWIHISYNKGGNRNQYIVKK